MDMFAERLACLEKEKERRIQQVPCKEKREGGGLGHRRTKGQHSGGAQRLIHLQ